MSEQQERRVEGTNYYIRGDRDTVAAGLISPSPWNPNEMTNKQFEALKGAIREHGFMQEVLVRRHPERNGEFQAIDGEHRQRAVQALAEMDSESPVDVRIIEAADHEAKTITLFMNRDRGEHNTLAEARLLKELSKMEIDLGAVLPWSDAELDERISLADVEWGDYGSDNDAEPESDGEPDLPEGVSSWMRFEVVMTKEDYEAYQEARALISREQELTGDQAIQDGQAVAALTAEFLGGHA